MSIFSRISALVFVASTLVFVALGCGGTGSNNDQGTSFLALGFFADVEGEAGETGAIVPLFTDDPTVTLNESGLFVDGRFVTTFIGVQNRLSVQFLRITRVDCSYNIAGADAGFSIPDDSTAMGNVLAPAGSGGTEDADATAEAFFGNNGFFQFEILSPDIISYINVNQNSLPALPFRMTVSCLVVGVSQAGDVFFTNLVNYFVQFVDVAECCTGSPSESSLPVAGAGGFQGGTGSGGTFDSFGDPTPEGTTTDDDDDTTT